MASDHERRTERARSPWLDLDCDMEELSLERSG
jgi:hypothetical protein